MRAIACGLSLMPTEDFAAAAMPLFDSQEVDALEWSFDIGWRRGSIPNWAGSLLENFSRQEKLSGHSVSYSPFTIPADSAHDHFLNRLKQEAGTFSYRRISDHSGVSRTAEIADTAPLPLPWCGSLVEHTCRLLEAMKQASGLPCGLENLALCLGREDVFMQGPMLKEILSKTQGFLVLDLHNLFCQMVNFNLHLSEILSTYPLDLVAEIHVSGGSWTHDPKKERSLRRDTHDGEVPGEVFNLLAQVLPLCPRADTVILERIGNSMNTDLDSSGFRADFHRIKDIVNKWSSHTGNNAQEIPSGHCREVSLSLREDVLINYTHCLTRLLGSGGNPEAIIENLKQSFDEPALEPYLHGLEPEMMSVAIELAAKWSIATEMDRAGGASSLC